MGGWWDAKRGTSGDHMSSATWQKSVLTTVRLWIILWMRNLVYLMAYHDNDMTCIHILPHWPFVRGIQISNTKEQKCGAAMIPLLFVSLAPKPINSLRPRQNGRYNTDDIFKCIFLKENVWIPTEISLKFVSEGPINNIPALVQIMAWRRPGAKPLSEPMMVCLLTHICVTRPQWVKTTNDETIEQKRFNSFWKCS